MDFLFISIMDSEVVVIWLLIVSNIKVSYFDGDDDGDDDVRLTEIFQFAVDGGGGIDVDEGDGEDDVDGIIFCKPNLYLYYCFD